MLGLLCLACFLFRCSQIVCTLNSVQSLQIERMHCIASSWIARSVKILLARTARLAVCAERATETASL